MSAQRSTGSLHVNAAQLARVLGKSSHQIAYPITSLEYFTGFVSEIEHLPAGSDYWAYLARKVQTLQAEYRIHSRSTFIAEPETK